MAKRARRVEFRLGQSSLQVKRVTGQNESFLNGSIRSWVESSRELGRVDSYFSNNFFFFFWFFEIDAIYQLFMSSLTVIRFSLVILLTITTKHLT